MIGTLSSKVLVSYREEDKEAQKCRTIRMRFPYLEEKTVVHHVSLREATNFGNFCLTDASSTDGPGFDQPAGSAEA